MLKPHQQKIAKRWNKGKEAFIDIDRPFIVSEYNKCMGGINLLDSCVSRYKYNLRSRRWYVNLFWHLVTLAVINAWLLYRRECRLINTPEKQVMSCKSFQSSVSTALIENNQENVGETLLSDKFRKYEGWYV